MGLVSIWIPIHNFAVVVRNPVQKCRMDLQHAIVESVESLVGQGLKNVQINVLILRLIRIIVEYVTIPVMGLVWVENV